MYFGGYNGLVVFHPDSIRANKRVPPLAFTKISLFNKGVEIGTQNGPLQQSINKTDHLTFHHNQNVFSIEFAALNFINPEKNQYAYKLQGFEDEWNYVEEPIATYMNLNRGNYILLVKGSNNDGLWNDTPLNMAITVLPPPWKSWWAYGLYTLVFFTLLYIWTRFYRTRVHLEHKLEIEHLEMTRQQELHQSKLNFFNNIAHEIRTPLTLVISPIEHMVEKYTDDPFLQKQLSIVTSNTNRLLRLLSQLLDFHKQETGNVPLKITEGNIVQWLKEIQNSFRGFADSRKIDFVFQCDNEKINADYDPVELEKAFYNLLANAFKFTPSGGKVSVSLHLAAAHEILKINTDDFVVAKDQPYIKIVIEDNGLGISPKHLTNIFHRFYQAEHSGLHEAGFGIGLALTKGIIDLHKGYISVESREATQKTSGFTRFTVFLPVRGVSYEKGTRTAYDEPLSLMLPLQPESFEGPEKTVAPDGKKVKQGNCKKPQVLIIEDNTEIRAYLKNILNEKYEVLEAGNGKYGWEIATEKLPDIILSDIVMPEMSGLELVSRLKKDERTDHIPVLLLTARGSLSNQLEGFNRGADDYISKPFNIQMLLLKIGNRLATREKLKEKFKRIVTLQPQFEEVKSPEDRFLQKLIDILETHVSDPDFNVSQLVMEIGMSRPVLFRKIKMLTGLSVIDLIKSVRLKKAEMLLKQNKLSVAEVAFHVGFNDPKYFSKSFRSHFGKTPSQYAEENL
jgi:signal transduction histidine kinase/DNA-binding response OmpR family regulator